MQMGMCRAPNARFSDFLGVYLGKSFIIIIQDNYFHLRPVLQRPGFSAANSCALGGFRCTKLEWLDPTQQGTRPMCPLPFCLNYYTSNLDKRARGTSARVPCCVGFSHSNLVHLNTHEALELAALKPGLFDRNFITTTIELPSHTRLGCSCSRLIGDPTS